MEGKLEPGRGSGFCFGNHIKIQVGVRIGKLRFGFFEGREVWGVVESKRIVNEVIGQHFGHMEAETCPKNLSKMHEWWGQHVSEGKAGFGSVISSSIQGNGGFHCH